MSSLAACGRCVSSGLDHPSSSISSSSSVFLHGGKSTAFSVTIARKQQQQKQQKQQNRAAGIAVCDWTDFIGGDLIRPDRGKFQKDLETHGSLAIYPPLEGGYEGRYMNKLLHEGYHIMPISARGLGDLESYLTKVHAVRPPHLGRQPIAVWYFPPIVDYRLSLLPKDCRGLVLWVHECKVLSKSELQFLTLLPALRPNVLVVAEVGGWRRVVWCPLKNICGTPAAMASSQAQEEPSDKKELVLVPEESKELVTE